MEVNELQQDGSKMMSTLASSVDWQDCICREADGTKELTSTSKNLEELLFQVISRLIPQIQCRGPVRVHAIHRIHVKK